VDSLKIEVAIIEDQTVIRNGLAYLINADENFSVRCYSSAEAALKDFARFRPQVVLMDIQLPDMNGIDATRIIKEKYPDTQVMMCTVYEDDEKIFNALAAGASGYILKKSSPTALLNAIREIQNGGAPISSQIARKLVDYFQKPKIKITKEQLPELTRREKEILKLLSEGYRNKEIAEKLFLSISTIRTHIYNIYDKLHVQSRVEAINKMRENMGEN